MRVGGLVRGLVRREDFEMGSVRARIYNRSTEASIMIRMKGRKYTI